jgi:hypothetical protein
MKPLLSTFVLLSTFFNMAIAQRTTPEKKDNLIVIITDSTANYNFTNFGKYLIENGFSFSATNREFMTITTNERTSKGAYKYILNISFKDKKINVRAKCTYLQFNGSYSYGAKDLAWTDWFYAPSKHSANGIAYYAFLPILEGFGKTLYYYSD